MKITLRFSLEDVLEALLGLRHDREERKKHHQELMNGLQNLTTAVTGLTTAAQGLTTAVDAAVTDINTLGPSDAQLNTLADTVNGLSATLAAQTQRLTEAVNAPAPAAAPTA